MNELFKNKSVTRTILPIIIGNIIEWYEYTLFIYFAIIISNLFFPPNSNPLISIIWTFMTFWIGALVRPIGGIIFGYIGDKLSRKLILTVSIALMAIPTILIGLMPTYNQIGIIAPITLLILRIIQGLALGGEFGASCVFLFEISPTNKKGLYCSFALLGIGIGIIFSAITVMIIESSFSEYEIYNFAWRIPFLISFINLIISLILRRNLGETRDFIEMQNRNKIISNPFITLIKNHKLLLLKLLTIFLTTKTAFYIAFFFCKTIMIEKLNFADHLASKFNIYTIFSYTIATIIFGYLSDLVNRTHMMLLGNIGILAVAYPFVLAIQVGTPSDILVMSILLGTFIAMIESCLNPITIESFPANIRNTSVALCWNLAAGIFGGGSGVVLLWLIKFHGGIINITYYLIAVSTVTLIILINDLRPDFPHKQSP